jgi:hypothetical protein
LSQISGVTSIVSIRIYKGCKLKSITIGIKTPWTEYK